MNSPSVAAARCGALLALRVIGAPRAPSIFRAGAHFNKEKLARIGEFFATKWRPGKIPGAILLIQQHGKPVYHEAFGVQDVATKAPITDETIFRLFSMTKADHQRGCGEDDR